MQKKTNILMKNKENMNMNTIHEIFSKNNTNSTNKLLRKVSKRTILSDATTRISKENLLTAQNQQQKLFKTMLKEYFQEEDLNGSTDQLISLCQNNGIYIKQQLLSKEIVIKPNNMKELLMTDLGYLIVQNINDKLIENNDVQNERELQIIEFLGKQYEQQKQLMQQYEHFMEHIQAQLEIFLHLQTNFNKVRQKLTQFFEKHKVNKNNFINEIKRQNNVINLKKIQLQLKKCNLNSNQIRIIFKFCYYDEYHIYLQIINLNNMISTTKFLQSILNISHNSQISCQQIVKPTHRYIKNTDNIIQQLLQDKQNLMMQLEDKEKIISQQNLQVEMVKFQLFQMNNNLVRYIKNIKSAVQNNLNKQINILFQNSEQKSSVIQWYQSEIEGIVQKFNEELQVQEILKH